MKGWSALFHASTSSVVHVLPVRMFPKYETHESSTISAQQNCMGWKQIKKAHVTCLNGPKIVNFCKHILNRQPFSNCLPEGSWYERFLAICYNFKQSLFIKPNMMPLGMYEVNQHPVYYSIQPIFHKFWKDLTLTIHNSYRIRSELSSLFAS